MSRVFIRRWAEISRFSGVEAAELAQVRAQRLCRVEARRGAGAGALGHSRLGAGPPAEGGRPRVWLDSGHTLIYEADTEALEPNPVAALRTLMDYFEAVARARVGGT